MIIIAEAIIGIIVSIIFFIIFYKRNTKRAIIIGALIIFTTILIIIFTLTQNPMGIPVNAIAKIKDTQAPEIVLNGEENIEQEYTNEYQELGATAIDDKDGDITNNIIIEKKQINENEFKIIYTCVDNSGNASTKTRNIKYIDKIPPEIKLVGKSNININVGEKYEEKGATAIDERDGELTANIETNGLVDTSKEGKYTITYKIKDKSGNEASINRTITVNKKVEENTTTKEEKVENKNQTANQNQTTTQNNNQAKPQNTTQNTNQDNNKNTSEKKGIIYLTFDDGPSTSSTPQILDILKKKNVKATFFILNYDSAGEKLVKREVSEGHTVAIHGYSHEYKKIYASVEAYMENITKLQEKIKASTGYNATITRFPGGSSNTVSKFNPGIMTKLTQEVVAKGYKYFDWNISSEDAASARSSKDVYNNVIKGLSKNKTNLVLMHDFGGNTKTVNALEDIINYGINNGYTFSAITADTPMIKHGVNN